MVRSEGSGPEPFAIECAMAIERNKRVCADNCSSSRCLKEGQTGSHRYCFLVFTTVGLLVSKGWQQTRNVWWLNQGDVIAVAPGSLGPPTSVHLHFRLHLHFTSFYHFRFYSIMGKSRCVGCLKCAIKNAPELLGVTETLVIPIRSIRGEPS